MTKKLSDIKYLAIELILEDGMCASAVAEIVGENPETVENWLSDYHQEQEEKLCQQETELIDMQKRMVELQEEHAIHRCTYDLILDHPDLESEKLANKHWEKIPEKVKHKIITNSFCVDCGATIITEYVMQGNEKGITFYGKCCKCGKSMATSFESSRSLGQ